MIACNSRIWIWILKSISIVEELLKEPSFRVFIKLIRHLYILSDLFITFFAKSFHDNLSFLLSLLFGFNNLSFIFVIVVLLKLQLNLDASISVIVLKEMLKHRFFTLLTWVWRGFAQFFKHISNSFILVFLIEGHFLFLGTSTHWVYFCFYIVFINLLV